MRISSETAGESNPEIGISKLSGKEKFQQILGLFGTDTARNNFLDLCKQYFELRVRDDARSGSETYRTRRDQYSPARRSGVHNAIMASLKRLSLIPKIPDATRKILNEMADREIAATYLTEYLRSSESRQDEDEEDEDAFGNPKKGGRSNVAYFHSLGRGE